MEKNWLTKSSFKFGTTDMFQRFGIMLTGEPEDVLLPALRPRKVKIPNRHGEYDFGAKYYEERGLKLPCTTVKTRDRISVREISYLLSKKSEIRVWNEPEKYYIGRIYDATVLNQIRNIGNEFDLVFCRVKICLLSTDKYTFCYSQCTLYAFRMIVGDICSNLCQF